MFGIILITRLLWSGIRIWPYVSKLRVYASANNLFLLTKYSGFDPEVNMRSSNLMPSFDFGAYPKNKAFTFGVELNF